MSYDEQKVGDDLPEVIYTKILEAWRMAAREANQAERERRDKIAKHAANPPEIFYNPLGVDEAKWHSMNRKERREFIRRNK